MTNDLLEFKKELAAKRIKGLALDIDEVLAFSTGYWVKEMQIKFGNPEELTIHEMVAKYRFCQDVPYWQTEEAFVWMRQTINSNECQENLPLIENSNKIVQKINKIIPVVCYITSRPKLVINGTKKWLEKYNFPDVNIIFRPSKVDVLQGTVWKAKVLEYLYPQVLGIVDDNPNLVNHLSKNYRGTVYLYNNLESPRKDLKIIACKTWIDVLKNIKKV